MLRLRAGEEVPVEVRELCQSGGKQQPKKRELFSALAEKAGDERTRDEQESA
jgi:hypothetical protein